VELAKLGLKEMPKHEDFDVAKVPAVVQADVALQRAKNNLARERALNRRGAGTAQDLQNAENDLRGAEAKLAHEVLVARSTLANAQAARVALDVAKLARSDMEVRTPVPFINPPGVTTPVTYAVTKRSVAEGQMLKQGDAIADLVIENPLRLWLNVPERYSSEVQVGQPVRLTVASHSETPFEGKVARINPAVDHVSRTFQVEARVPNNLGMLRPGGFAKASILIDRQSDAMVVPLESIVRFAGVTKLFVVEADKARAINVETGLEGTGWVEILGKLPPQAQVVITGQTQLADGTPVVVRAKK
jgi:RND family efflux transporter MFP subunit